MTPESVQLVRVGCRDQRFAKWGGHFSSGPIGVEQSLVKMAELDRVKAIDLFKQARADRTAQHIKRMGRDGKDRSATGRIRRGGHFAAGTDLAQCREILQPLHLRTLHVPRNCIRPMPPYLSRPYEPTPHLPC